MIQGKDGLKYILPSLSIIVIIKLDVGISIELEFKLVDEILTDNCSSFSRSPSSWIVMLGHRELPIVYTNGELGTKSSLIAGRKVMLIRDYKDICGISLLAVPPSSTVSVMTTWVCRTPLDNIKGQIITVPSVSDTVRSSGSTTLPSESINKIKLSKHFPLPPNKRKIHSLSTYQHHPLLLQ